MAIDKETKESNKLLESLSISSNEMELNYNDRYLTLEQKERDHKVSELLEYYVDSYKHKVDSSKGYRLALFVICMLIISSFAASFLVIVFKLISNDFIWKVETLIGFMTASLSFAGLIIGLLTIITKYFFPENDEQYITKIVELIQKNDLENKRENAKNGK